jgi:two-component system KDP operon response regulator KdpE
LAQRILVVDDDPAILRVVEMQLSFDGFESILAENGESAILLAERERPDLIILDVMMPGMDGKETMQRIREKSSTPIVMLTAQRDDGPMIKALNDGADDYVAKPFNPEELSARVRAILRTGATAAVQETVCVGNVEIDLERRMVKKDGAFVSLSRTEWGLLMMLVEKRGRVVQAEEILMRLWGSEQNAHRRQLRVWISRLRRKLEDDPTRPQLIKTEAWVGYMLCQDV